MGTRWAAAPHASVLGHDCIPLDWAELTPAWMTAALQTRHPGVEVSKITVLMRDDGTNRRARIGLTYAAGEGPSTLFLKAHAASHRVAHLRNGNLWNEARLFARDVALPVDHPVVYKAIVDLLGLDFLLVMEDLEQRAADPRDSTRPLTPAQVASGLKGLARLHSRYWGLETDGHPKLDWLQTWAATQGWRVGLGRCIPLGLERARSYLPKAVASLDGEMIVDLWSRYVDGLVEGPMTLLHGDAHIGNTYVLPDGEIGFLDWRVVRRGGWSQDVGYFLIGALTVEDRRAHEAELLEIYRTALEVAEDQRPSAQEAWRRYQASTVYGLAVWLSTLGADGYQRPEVSLALCERYAAAFAELGARQVLGA